MTLQKFKSKVISYNGFDKYIYYVLFSILCAAGIYIFYDVISNNTKYALYGTTYFAYGLSIFLIFIGLLGFKLIPNRYKVLIINSSLPLLRKQEAINNLMLQLDHAVCLPNEGFYG